MRRPLRRSYDHMRRAGPARALAHVALSGRRRRHVGLYVLLHTLHMLLALLLHVSRAVKPRMGFLSLEKSPQHVDSLSPYLTPYAKRRATKHTRSVKKQCYPSYRL